MSHKAIQLGIIDLTLEYIGLHTPQNGRILTVTQTDHIDEGKPLTPPWHPRTIALIQRDEEVRQAIMTNTLMHLRGIHSTMIFQEIVQSTRFKQSDRHHFCVLLYRPEVPIHADLSTSMICPRTQNGQLRLPYSSTKQRSANKSLPRRKTACSGDQVRDRQHNKPPTCASFTGPRPGRNVQGHTLDTTSHRSRLPDKDGYSSSTPRGSIDQVAPEYRRVVFQRRTPDRPPIGFDYRGDFQWLNQGFWHCGMITQIAHYPEYRPEDPSDDYPTYWVTFYSRKGAVRCSRVGEVPDPAVQGGRLVIRQGPKPFPKVPMHPDLGKQPQVAPNPRPDPATTKGNDPSPPEIPEATASLKEPTTSQNQNLPQPEIPPAKGIEAPATPPSTHPSLPTGSLRKTTSPPQPSAPHIFEGVTRKSRSKSPPTARADSDDEIDLEHLINDEAEGWRLEQEENRQQSRNTPPPPTTPTPDKCKEQQTRASVDTPQE
eukprot:g14696.t1